MSSIIQGINTLAMLKAFIPYIGEINPMNRVFLPAANKPKNNLSLHPNQKKTPSVQKLLQFIGTRCYISSELRARIEQDFHRIETKAGDVLLKQDRHANKLYFIDQGLMHNYYYHDGKQVSSWFYNENQFDTAWYSFYAQKPGFEEIACLEDCVLFEITFEKYQKLIADFPAFGNFARLLAEEILAFLDYFSKSWSFLSAKEKYDLLQTHFPLIEQRVKLGQIATFLGISQETLSRIRNK